LAYSIVLSKQAEKYINKQDKPSRERFAKELSDLAKDPIGSSKALVNTDPPIRSFRIGGWRLVLDIKEAEKIVMVVMVQPRGQVYDRI